MKKAVKLTAVLLVLAVILSCSCIGAFADSERTVKQYGVVDETGYGGYVAFGDSVSRGCGATEKYNWGFAAAGYDGTYYEYEHRIMNNSFPYIVAQAVGCTIADDYTIKDKAENTYVPACFCGMTLTQVMDSLGIEHDYYDEEYDHGCWSSSVRNMATYCSEAKDAVQTAGLITVELGMCDVLWRASYLANLATDDEINAEWVSVFLEELDAGYERWVNCYPAFIRQLKEWNENATIVLVGSYNCSFNRPLTDETVLPVGTAVSAITSLMNKNYVAWAEEFDAIYVDISNVDTVASQYGWSITSEEHANDSTIAGHPSVEGNTYIARQILAALPSAGVEEEAPSNPTDIVIDLGRFTSASFVAVDNSFVSDYSVDGYTLTVPYDSPDATVLTVVVMQEDGNIAVYTYQLVYNDGYTAYRIYSTNDAVGTAQKFVNNAVSVGKRVASALSSLFSE